MARRSSEAVWARGLLTKGNGICHGVAGNGYAFLSLRKADGADGRHLHRAKSFAGACVMRGVLCSVAAACSATACAAAACAAAAWCCLVLLGAACAACAACAAACCCCRSLFVVV